MDVLPGNTGQHDPLRILRNTLANKQTIHLLPSSSPSSVRVYTLSECSHLSLPPPSASSSSAAATSNDRVILPKTTSTRFKRTPQSDADQTWDIQSLLLCYLRRDASIAEYAQEAVKEGCELVGIMQRKLVADYLEGKDTTGLAAPYIVPELDPSVPSANNGSAAQDASNAGNGTLQDENFSSTNESRPAKKTRYIVNKEDLEAYKRITGYWESKQISDRTTVLRGTIKKGNFANVRDIVQDRLKAGKEDMRKGTHGQGGTNTVQAVGANIPVLPAQQLKRRSKFRSMTTNRYVENTKSLTTNGLYSLLQGK